MISKINCFIALLFLLITTDTIIYDFNKESNLSGWRIVDDGVMGGISQGKFRINEKGNGVFFGEVSLENNGGFSSIRYRFKKIDVTNFKSIIIKLKGDGKNYQFRVKSNARDYYSYVSEFSTSNSLEEVSINLSDMYPSFRGRRLNMRNFSSNYINEIAILISNKKNESFQLEIDKIYLE